MFAHFSALDFVVMIPAFIFVLGIVVFFHELGHFLVARWCGVKVDAFSLGFGRELFGYTDRHETRWRVSAIPLGGYVKFHGDLNGASVPDPATIAAMPEASRRVSFFAQPVWKRAAIVAAGPLASFLLAIAIFSASLLVSGEKIVVPRIGFVLEVCQRPLKLASFDRAALNRPLYADEAARRRAQSTPAEAAGFKAGDLVLSIDGQNVRSFTDIPSILSVKGDDTIAFDVRRGAEMVRLTAVPYTAIVDGPLGKQRDVRIGIGMSSDPKDVRTERFGPVQAVARGTQQVWDVLHKTVVAVGRIFSGRESVDQISGPVGIAGLSGAVAKMGFVNLLTLAAFLSASIGLTNLLPIPLLDGGHLLYYAIEALRGRPLSLRSQEFGFRVGLAIVALLLVFATSNDILKSFRG